MSRTQIRNGNEVYNGLTNAAFLDLLNDKPKRYYTVGEVASFARKSKPTCRKYLKKLVEMGRATMIFVAGAEWYQHVEKV